MSDHDLRNEEAEEVSSASWRPKFLMREGRKNRVSPVFIRCSLIAAAVIAVALQLTSGFKVEVRQSVQETFGLPGPQSLENAVTVPAFNPVASKAASELRSRSSSPDGGKPLRIQPIQLSDTSIIPTGAEAKAMLSSGGTNGTIVGKLTEGLIADGDLLLPKGTVLYGSGSSSDDRLFVRFKKAILPDKVERKIRAQAFDIKDRMIGLKGKKISDVAFRFAASSGLIFLAGLAEGMKEDQVNIYGAPRKPTVRDAALNGVTTATLEQGRELMTSMRNRESRVEVQSATEIIVIFGDAQDSEE